MFDKILQLLKSHPFRSLFALLAIVSIIVAFVVAGSRGIESKSSIQLEFWNTKGISNYQMRVVTLALPSPPIGEDLTIQNGKITKATIIACENPSVEYPEYLCDPIRRFILAWANILWKNSSILRINALAEHKIQLPFAPRSAQAVFKGFPVRMSY